MIYIHPSKTPRWPIKNNKPTTHHLSSSSGRRGYWLFQRNTVPLALLAELFCYQLKAVLVICHERSSKIGSRPLQLLIFRHLPSSMTRCEYAFSLRDGCARSLDEIQTDCRNPKVKGLARMTTTPLLRSLGTKKMRSRDHPSEDTQSGDQQKKSKMHQPGERGLFMLGYVLQKMEELSQWFVVCMLK